MIERILLAMLTATFIGLLVGITVEMMSWTF